MADKVYNVLFLCTGNLARSILAESICDDAAGETCPVWLGKPTTARWGIPDPAAVKGTELQKKAAFAHAFNLMSSRINLFLSLPMSSIDPLPP